MSDSENDYEEETGPRFNKAILGRILAVGLFVALGTFAVVQSMRGNDNDASNTETTGGQLAEGLGDAAEKLKSGVSTTASDLKKAAGNAFNKTTDALTPKKNAFVGNTSVRPNVVKPASSEFAVKSNPNLPNSKPLVSKPGGFQPLKTPVVVSKPVTNNPAKAPERFAQAPGGAPIIGNNGGFAPRTTSPNSAFATKTPSNSFGGNSTAGKFGAAANNLKSNINTAADDLLRKTSETAKSTGQSFKNSFGDAARKTGAALKPKSNFTPPVVKSDFGRPGNNSPFANSNKVTASTSDPAKRPDSRAFGAKTFAPPKNQKSATLNTQRELAPISTNRSNQTTSPFGAQSGGSTSRSSGGSTFNSNRKPAPASSNTRRPSTQSPFAASNQRPTSPSKSSPFSGASNSQTNSRAGTSVRSATDLGGLATLSRNVPGDRQLEGVQAPALTVEKLSPREIQVNQTADFQLIIKNVGRVSAEDVKVFDQTPIGTQFIGASPQPASSRGGDLRWDIGTLRPGQEKRIKIQLKPTRHGEIGSVAHVTFATQASMRTLVTKPVLEIVHQAKNVHLIGDDVVFDITVKNKGDGPANNVMIQEDVPKQLEFQDGSQAIEYPIGTLMPGQSKRLRLALKAAQIGKIRNVMFASADGGLEAKHELPLEVVAPNLVAKSDGPTRRFLQRNVAHSFSVANNGTAKATNVELIARLPSGLRFQAANNQGRYDSNAHSVYWSLAELARDAKATVELKTTPVEIGTQPIKFETLADLEVRASVVQPMNVEHLVDVFFDIDDVVDPIEIGSNTSYKIRVVNQGTKAATNVRLGVTFPRGLQPTAVNGSIRHQINGQQIAFEPINSMSPGDEISFEIESKGQSAGDHRVEVNMQTDGRQTTVTKEETTRVYSDR